MPVSQDAFPRLILLGIGCFTPGSPWGSRTTAGPPTPCAAGSWRGHTDGVSLYPLLGGAEEFAGGDDEVVESEEAGSRLFYKFEGLALCVDKVGKWLPAGVGR